MDDIKNGKLYVIVHNVRSAYNVGAIFRVSDGMGVKKIYLSGYTPAPWTKNKRPYKTVAERMIEKTALGAQEYVLWEKADDIFKLINELKKKKFSILALEQDKRNINIEKAKIKFPCVLIVGNETKGLAKDILNFCDTIISIPMRGKKESLNVGVATGIALYVILK